MSILIRDTTREERMEIVAQSLGEDYIGCDRSYSNIDYSLYIDGKVELKELNAMAKIGIEVANPNEDDRNSSCFC